MVENVSYLPLVLGMSRKARRRLAYETLRRVGLAHRMSAFPRELSGGEQQRIAIARAIINEPEILLADEPTGNLDPHLSRDIFQIFREINLKGTTVLIATHDWDLVHQMGQRVLRVDEGQIVSDEDCPGSRTHEEEGGGDRP